MIPAELHKGILELIEERSDRLPRPDRVNGADFDFQPLFGDGSARRFIRVFHQGRPCCLAVAPAAHGNADYAEFRSSWSIANHLHEAGVPVPEPLAAHSGLGLILFEDLGDTRLHDLLMTGDERAGAMLDRAVEVLAHMQVAGAAGFKTSWCCDTEAYDRTVMVEREAGYFYRAFWKDTLFGEDIDGLAAEFAHLATMAEAYFEPRFLHRDFQSRNVMITGGAVRVIDFQSARLGPPGYDIASLLIDPYAALSPDRQDELFERYLRRMETYPAVDTARIRASYPYLALQRNLQIIGAFAYLSGHRRKPFFRHYLMPSLVMLQNRLSSPLFDEFEILRRTAGEAFRRYRSRHSG